MSSKSVEPSTRIAYGYARVSTAEQVDGESLDVQRQKIEALALLHGFTLAGVFVDPGVSASKPLRERPEGRKLWRAVRGAGAAIIATKLDRCFRDLTDASATLEACKAADISLVLGDLGGDVTRGSVAQLIFSIMGATAQFERCRLIERISEAKASQKAKGEYLGGAIPFAHRVVVRDGVRVLEADDALQGRVLDLKRREFSSRQIVAELRVVDGVDVSAVTVCKFLRAQAA